MLLFSNIHFNSSICFFMFKCSFSSHVQKKRWEYVEFCELVCMI